MRLARASGSRLWFYVLAAAMVAMSLALPRLGLLSPDRSVSGMGIWLAFVVEVPVYFWFFVLRPRRTSPLYAVPVAVAGYLFCRAWEPAQGTAWITWGWIPLLPFEVLLLTVLARRALRVARIARGLPRSSDLIERLSLASERVFPANRWIAVMMYELGLMYYALGGRPGIVLDPGDVAFTYHGRGGVRVVFAVALLLGAAEIVGLHLLLAAWSPIAAWMLSAFEFYGVVWVVGLLRSVSHLPIVLTERGVHVRWGVVYTLFIPYDAIEHVQKDRLHAVVPRRANYLNCAFIHSPDCVLHLRASRIAELPYTLSKRVNEVGILVDEPREFLAQLAQRVPPPRATG